MSFLLTILVALIGAWIALKFKVPAGAMIGGLFAVAIFNIFTGEAQLSQSFKIITQISTGSFIGAKITSNDVKGLKNIFIPSLLMVILMAIFNFIMGFFIYKTTDIDIVTALFATAPGGIADMSIIAYDFGAEASKVALLQLIRLISVVGIMPTVIKLITKKNKIVTQKNEGIIANNKNSFNFNENLKRVLLTLVIGTVGGIIGWFLNIPAGAMSISMVSTAFYNIRSNKAYMPIKLRQLIQVLAGALIGAKMTMTDLISLKIIIIPVLIVILGFCMMNILLGLLIYKITDFSIQTSFFSASPGGMSDMSIIASELGADTSKVATMQFCRLVSVVAFYPILIDIIKKFFI